MIFFRISLEGRFLKSGNRGIFTKVLRETVGRPEKYFPVKPNKIKNIGSLPANRQWRRLEPCEQLASAAEPACAIHFAGLGNFLAIGHAPYGLRLSPPPWRPPFSSGNPASSF